MQGLAQQHERHPGDEHEHATRPDDGRTGELADRHVRRRVTACRYRGHGVQHRVEEVHAGSPVAQEARDRQCEVHGADRPGDRARACREFLGLVARLGAEQPHAADPKVRHDRDRHHDDPDPAHPLQQRAPQQQAFRHRVESGQYRRPRRRDPGDGLEHCIDDTQVQGRPAERQCADDADRNPAEHGEQVHLSRHEPEVGLPGRQRERNADPQRDHGGQQERARIDVKRTGREPDEDRRHQQRCRAEDQQDGDDKEDGLQVNHRMDDGVAVPGRVAYSPAIVSV